MASKRTAKHFLSAINGSGNTAPGTSRLNVLASHCRDQQFSSSTSRSADNTTRSSLSNELASHYGEQHVNRPNNSTDDNTLGSSRSNESASHQGIRHVNPFNNFTDDTTSEASQSNEFSAQNSNSWLKSNPPLPLVQMITPSQQQQRQLEQTNTKELQQRIKALETQIADNNNSRYSKISAYAQRGKNILGKSKHVMTPQDLINQGVVATFLRESVWPRTKLLPKNWTTWREDRNSLCQMILKKVAVPLGIDGRMYWESMLLSMTNSKFCSLRSNFKQDIFEQFQGKI